MLTAVVVLATPPFWLTIAMDRTVAVGVVPVVGGALIGVSSGWSRSPAYRYGPIGDMGMVGFWVGVSGVVVARGELGVVGGRCGAP